MLVYYENQIPNVFEGNLEEEEEVLQWLITQKTEDRIELITRTMLESFVEDTQYLAVYFCKYLILRVVSVSYIEATRKSHLFIPMPFQTNKTASFATKYSRDWSKLTTSVTFSV